MTSWSALDRQMQTHRHDLMEHVKIVANSADRLATTISAEVRFLNEFEKGEVSGASPVPIADRLTELRAFQGWMDLSRANALAGSPFVTRAKVITQNYICFIYLPESCFLVLRKTMPKDSVTRKCAMFLTDNPVRAFRNSIAHSNWTYEDDFTGLIYWARKGKEPNEPLQRFTVSDHELAFWQALSRCVAYAAFSNL